MAERGAERFSINISRCENASLSSIRQAASDRPLLLQALDEHSIPHFCLLTQLIKMRFSHFYDHKVISAMLPRVARSENSPPQVEGEATSNAATGGGRATSGEKNLMNFSTLPKDSMLNGIKSSVYAMTRV